MLQAKDYQQRWNEVGAAHFERAYRAGVATDLEVFLDEMFSLVELSPFAVGPALGLGLEGLLIPREAPPFLCLESETRLLKAQPELGGRLSLYLDGRGNPLCVEVSSAGGAVVWLDHDQAFRGRIFVNSSVAAFAEALLLSASMQLGKRNRLEAMEELDPAAMAPGTFWATHLDR